MKVYENKVFERFDKAKEKAKGVLEEGQGLDELQGAVENKVKKSKGKIREGIDDIYTLLRMVAAYASGEYREVAVKSMVAIVGALIYFLNPMDVIPDFITTFGFLDDLTVLAYVIKTFKDEIDRFVHWEMEGKDVADEE